MIQITPISDLASAEWKRPVDLTDYERVVAPIIAAVRDGGDEALHRYARIFDDLGDTPICVGQHEIATAALQFSRPMRAAADTAIHNIREFAQLQLPKETFHDFGNGRRLGWVVRPLEAAGCYIPSGRYPLPSTLLMTAVLAQTAGVRRICITTPRPSTEILGCAHLLGLREIYRVGGAQAIAAMAYGTETIKRVDRIVGPGNAYVAAAKKLLAGEVGIDFIAGPTEILILAADGDARIIAADMLAQAEHDVSASAILVTTSPTLAGAVQLQIEEQLKTLATRNVARLAINEGGRIYVTSSIDLAIAITNAIAPEHLSLHDPSLLPRISNAGTIFLGANSPESAGDYAAGPSHVLPTNGAARLRGGLSTTDFVKVIAVQDLSPPALRELAPAITTLARSEGLEAHARAVEVRLAG